MMKLASKIRSKTIFEKKKRKIVMMMIQKTLMTSEKK